MSAYMAWPIFFENFNHFWIRCYAFDLSHTLIEQIKLSKKAVVVVVVVVVVVPLVVFKHRLWKKITLHFRKLQLWAENAKKNSPPSIFFKKHYFYIIQKKKLAFQKGSFDSKKSFDIAITDFQKNRILSQKMTHF